MKNQRVETCYKEVDTRNCIHEHFNFKSQDHGGTKSHNHKDDRVRPRVLPAKCINCLEVVRPPCYVMGSIWSDRQNLSDEGIC
jgi:hypothetical protein